MKRASEPRDLGVVGRYELLFELATGGMGRVFVARQLGDAGFERIVALKRVHPHLVSDPDVYGMASDEARLTALLHHPNIVPVIDVVDAKGELVLVMDYVEGASLASLLRSRNGSSPESADGASNLAPTLDLGLASRIALDTLRGLAAAHSASDLQGEPLELVHRDVSPQNLIVGVDGTTRLIDFGIARAEGRLTLTKTGVIKGKVLYMAPERLEEGAVDRRADLFSVGAILFELVVGKWAFGVGDEAQQMSRILLGEIDFAPLRALAPALAPVIERALARSPRDRFDSAEEFARALVAAQPPAELEDVAAYVKARKAPELESKRARIAEEINRRLASGSDDPQTASGIEVASPSVEAASTVNQAPAEARRRSSTWLFAIGVGALVLNTAGWYALTRDSPKIPREPGAAASVFSSSAVVPIASATPSSEPVAARAPLSSAAPAISTASVTGAPSAAATPRGPGLEPSPYGTGLRHSPYKRP